LYVSVCRHLSFSSPRLSNDHDNSTSAGADLSSHRPHSFYSASSDRLNSWQSGMARNIQSSPGDVNGQWYQSSTDASRSSGESRFWSDLPSPSAAGSAAVRTAVRQAYPISSSHSSLHNSSDFIVPSSSNFDHT